MKLHAHASEISHLLHILPIWQALPAHIKGTITTPKNPVAHYASTHGTKEIRIGRPRGEDNMVLVASFLDSQTCRNQRRIYLEHGAGQTYPDCRTIASNGSYSGGDGHEGTVAFLCPSKTVADRWAKYKVPRYIIGTPPYLDPWLTGDKSLVPADPPTIAVAFHWDGSRLCPELASAWGAFRSVMPALIRKYPVIAHGHPRAIDIHTPQWQEWGVEVVPDLHEVLARAHVLIADNTSLLYEFAVLNRPVLAMRSPDWRKDARHGLRFYDNIPGIDCGDPRHLLDDLDSTIAGDAYALSRRVIAAKAAYDVSDGHSTQRAVEAVLEVCARYGS